MKFNTIIRSGFTHYLGCTVPCNLFPVKVPFPEGQAAGYALIALTNAVAANHAFGYDDYRALDSIVVNRPVEWGMPDGDVTLDLTRDLHTVGPPEGRGWRAHHGDEAYTSHALRAEGSLWWSYIPYGLHVVNVISQYLNMGEVPNLRASTTDSGVGQVTSWSAPAPINHLTYEAASNTFLPGALLTFSWANMQVAAPAILGDQLEENQLMAMAAWRKEGPTPLRVGMPRRKVHLPGNDGDKPGIGARARCNDFTLPGPKPPGATPPSVGRAAPGPSSGNLA